MGFFSTVNLLLTVAILAAVGFAIYWLVGEIQDFGGLNGFFENLGEGAVGGLTGFVTGATTGLFNFGKSIGNKWNPFD
jgi:hypothetical protein